MQQISTEGVQGETRLVRQGDPLGNVQEISVRPYVQMVRGVFNKFQDFFVQAFEIVVDS